MVPSPVLKKRVKTMSLLAATNLSSRRLLTRFSLKNLTGRVFLSSGEDGAGRDQKGWVPPDRPAVDWMRTRRQALGQDGQTLLNIDSIEEDIPVKIHTLLTLAEISKCAEALGGHDIMFLPDNPRNKRMGDALGMIVVTGSTRKQLVEMADSLVYHMRRRKLDEKDVPGAMTGPEGDQFSAGSDQDNNNTGWVVVDCHNYVVHFQDERTRDHIDLVGLWTGTDELHSIDPSNEDAVEDYVAAHPVPADFGGSDYHFDDTLKQLEKSRWSTPRSSIQQSPISRRDRRRRGK